MTHRNPWRKFVTSGTAILLLLGGPAAHAETCFRTTGPAVTCVAYETFTHRRSISANGERVAFGDGVGIVVRNVMTGRTFQFPGMRQQATGPDLSASGRYVVFVSSFEDLAVTDLLTGDTEVVVDMPASALNPSISANGRFIAFRTPASDVFVHDRQTDSSEVVSSGWDVVSSGGGEVSPQISGNGRFVAFEVWVNSIVQIAVHDRRTDVTELVSTDPGGQPTNGRSVDPTLSSDGHFIGYQTTADNLGFPVPEHGGIVLHDRTTGDSRLISVFQGEVLPEGWRPTMSPEGGHVAFYGLLPNGVPSVFVANLESGRTKRVSVKPDGTWLRNGLQVSEQLALSSDGQYVVFSSLAGDEPLYHRGPIWG